MSFLLKYYSLVEVAYMFIRCSKTKFLLLNTNNTNTKHLGKDNIGKGGPTMSLDAFEYLFFDTEEEKQVMTSTFFWTWDLSSNRNQLGFFEEILYANKLKIMKVLLNVPVLL